MVGLVTMGRGGITMFGVVGVFFVVDGVCR